VHEFGNWTWSLLRRRERAGAGDKREPETSHLDRPGMMSRTWSFFILIYSESCHLSVRGPSPYTTKDVMMLGHMKLLDNSKYWKTVKNGVSFITNDLDFKGTMTFFFKNKDISYKGRGGGNCFDPPEVTGGKMGKPEEKTPCRPQVNVDTQCQRCLSLLPSQILIHSDYSSSQIEG